MSERLLVHEGGFAVLDRAGDIAGARQDGPDGMFLRDARHLSRWLLTLAGVPLRVLSSHDDGCVLTTAGTRDRSPTCTVFREQAVTAGLLTERVRVVNNSAAPLDVHLLLTVDADFADQFELRSDDRQYPKPGARRWTSEVPGGVAFHYARAASGGAADALADEAGAAWAAATTVTASPAPDECRPAGPPHPGTARTLAWRLALPARGAAVVDVAAAARAPGGPALPAKPPAPAEVRATAAADAEAFTARAPRPAELTDWPELARACEQGLADLARLRVPAAGPDGEPLRVPGAGVPWFLTLFGRDSLLASAFALPYRPELASATLRALAATQGRRHDAARQEQVGRIVHEIRHGELARFRQVPYGRYYGTVDATPLFLVLLGAHAEATGDASLARRLEPHARQAVEWMFRDGGLAAHGWLVYTSDEAGGGLANQNWKDSAGAICFRDGTPATGPLAVAEAQGYAYDALLRTAWLAREHWGDAAYAARLTTAAEDLGERFRAHFWLADADFPALALDGSGRQVDALASDAGHLLWSGILDPGQAARTGRRLLAPDFFSGWGIRTLAAGQPPFHPLSYHRGSVWPHDCALIALGLARHGLAGELRALAGGLVDAAARHDWRLPEVMAGYGRAEYAAPVPNPHTCSPQAWAAATPLALLTALRLV